MTVRVALADADPAVREGVSRLLSGASDVAVVAACADRDALMAAIEAHAPNVVVTDAALPPAGDANRTSLVAELRGSHAALGIVVLDDRFDPAATLGLADPAARGRAYLSRDRVHDPPQLLSSILAVAVGGSLVDPKLVEPLLPSRAPETRAAMSALTRREREVLAEIAQGRSNAAIADSMVLTKRAVEKHINSIFLKLELGDEEQVSRRVKAALLYLAD